MVLIKKEMKKGCRGKGDDENDRDMTLYDRESSDSSDSDRLGEAHKENLQDQEIQKDREGFECGSMTFICIK